MKRSLAALALFILLILPAAVMPSLIFGAEQPASTPATGEPVDKTNTPATEETTETPTSATPSTPTPSGGSLEFVPLTQLPGIQDLANSETLPKFLNSLYQICIGAAAVLAVLQIIRGGLSYMLGDSITEKKEARNTIMMAVVGLLLVLSPIIVFGLIDPRILSLQVNFSQLRPLPGNSTGNPGMNEGQSGTDAGNDSEGETDGEDTTDPSGEDGGDPQELPDEVVVTPDDNDSSDVTSGNATIAIRAGGEGSHTSVRLQATESANNCRIVQVIDYIREPPSAALERCRADRRSGDLWQCAPAGQTRTWTLPNICMAQGTALIRREGFN